jgi:hypothetical protein
VKLTAVVTKHMSTNYTMRFVGEELIYELRINDSKSRVDDLHTFSQSGFWCEWAIKNYNGVERNIVSVTDDQCEVIVYPTIAEAEDGAKKFLSI